MASEAVGSAIAGLGSVVSVVTPRITFFCGSLEPGRDGVGDYTRALANELSSEPGMMSAIALSDRYVDEATTEQQGSLSVLRLPFRTNLRDASVQSLLKAWIDEQSPEWLSLQFVCWSYAPHGVAWRLGPTLRELGGERAWHVMCHELWVGRQHGAKMAILGPAQMAATRRVLRSIAPAVLHTSLDSYIRRVSGLYRPATKLPLFGNIPVPSDLTPSRSRPPIRLLFFGSPPQPEDRTEIASEIRKVSATQAVTVSVLGGNDVMRVEFVAHMRTEFGETVPVNDLGFQDDRTVSEVLSRHDVGVSRMEGSSTGKSGTVLAMLEHGLAIWAPMWKDGDLDVAFRKSRLKRSLSEAADIGTTNPRSFRPEVAAMFVSALKTAGWQR
jgi:hypothetical protein